MSLVPTQQAYAQDRCVSNQYPSTGGQKDATIVGSVCDLSHQDAQAFKQQCRSEGDLKCSSSQTGFGGNGNFFKEHGNIPPKP